MRITHALIIVAASALAACDGLDVETAGRNAAMAALEASNPEVVQGIRAAQTLRQAAATCGWQDVDAAALAETAVASIEEPPLRAAASSLVQDLLVTDAPTPAAGAVAPTQCSPEARQALQAQIAAISQGEAGGEAEGEGEG